MTSHRGLPHSQKQRQRRLLHAAPAALAASFSASSPTTALAGAAAAAGRDGTPHALQRQWKRTDRHEKPQQQQSGVGERARAARRAWKVGAAYEGFCPLRAAGEAAGAAAAAASSSEEAAAGADAAAAVPGDGAFASPVGSASACPAAAAAEKLPMPQIVRLRVPDSFERFSSFRCSCCHSLIQQQDGQQQQQHCEDQLRMQQQQRPAQPKEQQQPQPRHPQQLSKRQDPRTGQQQPQTPQQQQEQQQESHLSKQLEQQLHKGQQQEKSQKAAAIFSTLPCVCSRCFYLLFIMKRQPAVIVSAAAAAWTSGNSFCENARRSSAATAAEFKEQSPLEKQQSLRADIGGTNSSNNSNSEARCSTTAGSSSSGGDVRSSSGDPCNSNSSRRPSCSNSGTCEGLTSGSGSTPSRESTFTSSSTSTTSFSGFSSSSSRSKEDDRLVDVQHLQQVWGDVEAFKKRAGALLVEVEMRQQAAAAFGHGVYRHFRFSHFLDQLQQGNPNLYLTTQAIPHGKYGPRRLCGPPLTGAAAADFPPLPLLFERLQPYQYNIWCGAAAHSSTGLHHDFHENLYILLRGKKVFRLFSPRVAGLLPTKGRIAHVHANGLIVYDKKRRADGAHPRAVRRWRQQQLEATLASLQSRLHSLPHRKNQAAKTAEEAAAAAGGEEAAAAEAEAAEAEAAAGEEEAEAAEAEAAAGEEAAAETAEKTPHCGAAAGAAAGSHSDAAADTSQRQRETEEGGETEEGRNKEMLRELLQQQCDNVERELEELLDAEVAEAAANAELDGGSSSSDEEEDEEEGEEGEETAAAGGGAAAGGAAAGGRGDASSSSLACECDACTAAAAGGKATAVPLSLSLSSSSPVKQQGRLVAAGELPDHFCMRNTRQRPPPAISYPLDSSQQPGRYSNACDMVLTPENILENYWEIELRAGECLYLPAGWFHEVISFPHETHASSTPPFSSKEKAEVCGLHMALNYWFHPPSRTPPSTGASLKIFTSEGGKAAAGATTAAPAAANVALTGEGGNEGREVSEGAAAAEEREKHVEQWAAACIDNPYEDTFWQKYTQPLMKAHEALRQKFIRSVTTGGVTTPHGGGGSVHMQQSSSQALHAAAGVGQQQQHAPQQLLQQQPLQRQVNKRQHQGKSEDDDSTTHQEPQNADQQPPQQQQQNQQALVCSHAERQKERQGRSFDSGAEEGLKRNGIESSDSKMKKLRKIDRSFPVEKCVLDAAGCHADSRMMTKKPLSRRIQKQLLLHAWSSHVFLKYASRRCMFYRVPPEFCYKFDAVGAARDPPCFPPLPDD